VLRLLYAVGGACLLLAARTAFAEGRFPASNQILFSSSDPNLIILRTTYAVLLSHDNGTTWQFLCEDALGLPISDSLDPEFGLTASNALVAAVPNEFHGMANFIGLDVSPDTGCTWSCVGGALEKQSVSDVVVRPDAPHAALAVTSTYRVDGGGLSSQVFGTTDDGAHWSLVGPAPDGVTIQTIEVANTDPARIYLSGTRGLGMQTTALLFVSTDSGTTWTERPLTLFDPTQEQFIWLAGVDPMDANRVYLRSSAPLILGGLSRLYVTVDAGKTFQKVLEFQVPPAATVKNGDGELLGFALSPDGSKVYAGSFEGGLFVAAKSDLKFHQVNSSPHADGQPLHIQCLATRGNELWACSDAHSGFVIGVSTDDGANFCPKMRQITSVTGPIVCEGGSGTTYACSATVQASGCKSPFDMWCEMQITQCQPDCPASIPAECRSDSGDEDAGVCVDAGSDAETDGAIDSGPDAGPDSGPEAGSVTACARSGGRATAASAFAENDSTPTSIRPSEPSKEPILRRCSSSLTLCGHPRSMSAYRAPRSHRSRETVDHHLRIQCW
jgi:hypothetical protein